MARSWHRMAMSWPNWQVVAQIGKVMAPICFLMAPNGKVMALNGTKWQGHRLMGKVMALNGKKMAPTGSSSIVCSIVTVTALCELWAQVCTALPCLLKTTKVMPPSLSCLLPVSLGCDEHHQGQLLVPLRPSKCMLRLQVACQRP